MPQGPIPKATGHPRYTPQVPVEKPLKLPAPICRPPAARQRSQSICLKRPKSLSAGKFPHHDNVPGRFASNTPSPYRKAISPHSDNGSKPNCLKRPKSLSAGNSPITITVPGRFASNTPSPYPKAIPPIPTMVRSRTASSAPSPYPQAIPPFR